MARTAEYDPERDRLTPEEMQGLFDCYDLLNDLSRLRRAEIECMILDRQLGQQERWEIVGSMVGREN